MVDIVQGSLQEIILKVVQRAMLPNIQLYQLCEKILFAITLSEMKPKKLLSCAFFVASYQNVLQILHNTMP